MTEGGSPQNGRFIKGDFFGLSRPNLQVPPDRLSWVWCHLARREFKFPLETFITKANGHLTPETTPSSRCDKERPSPYQSRERMKNVGVDSGGKRKLSPQAGIAGGSGEATAPALPVLLFGWTVLLRPRRAQDDP